MNILFKSIVMYFLFSLQITCFAFFECAEEKQNETSSKSQIEMLYQDFASVIQTSIKEIIKEYRVHEPKPLKKVYIVAQIPGRAEPIVFGLTEKQVLAIDRDEQGRACSDKHDRNDMSNRWCHAIIVKLVYETAKEMGIPNLISSMMGAAVFVVKEYVIDLHPSKPDLVIADYQLYKSKNNLEEVSGTIFGDGMFFINYEKKF